MHIKTSDQEILDLGFGNYTCNWGVHMCGLYETEKERDDIILGFLNKGARENDYQIYCPVERTKENFITTYSKRFPDCKHHLTNSDLMFLYNAKELYYPDGTFSPQSMDKGLNKFYEDSQKNGKRNIRATAEMVWALEAIPGIEYLMVYESKLNYFIPSKPWISICLYNVTKFSGEIIMNVLRTHPYTISNGIITQNPYYLDPTTWLKKYYPEFLNN